MKSLMSMPAFSKAWKEIREKPTTKFNELRTLEKHLYQGDPYYWEEIDLINSSCTKKNLGGSKQSELLLESDIAK